MCFQIKNDVVTMRLHVVLCMDSLANLGKKVKAFPAVKWLNRAVFVGSNSLILSRFTGMGPKEA
jgi:hypothetical protein